MTPARVCSLVLALFTLFFSAPSSAAQASVYGSVMYSDYGLSGYDGFVQYSGGLIGGAFYNFPIKSRFTAGLDGRLANGFGARGGVQGIGAVRLAFVPERVVLRPYLELGGSVTSANFIDPTRIRYTSGGLALIAGLDIRLTPSLDLRAVELGAGAGGGNHSAGSAFLDAGVVYHFKPKKL